MIARETGVLAELTSGLARDGFACPVIPPGNGLAKEIAARRPDLVMVEIDGYSAGVGIRELLSSLDQQDLPSIIALVPGGKLAGINGNLDADDFITSPYDSRELSLRIKRLLARRTRESVSGEVIKCDGLVIDRGRCEVAVGGRVVELTYREYELLCFLAGNPGHVYTRQALLDRVWGYDYYGGDRTVDVHIRRLRSKLDDANYNFIETVRNIGYRFKKNS
jgi:DNA-binding response OmpR family regulator